MPAQPTPTPKLRPVNDRLLLKPQPRPEQSTGGVFIPDTAREEDIDEGTVIAIGEQVPYFCYVNVGDLVVYAKYAGSEVKIDGETFILLPYKNVLAVYVSDAPVA